MLLFYDDYDRHSFQEVLINGREPDQDDNERPTDYTAEEDDNTQDTGETPAAAEPPANTPAEDNTNPVDNPEDYTVPDDAEGDNPPGGGGAATDNTPNTREGMGAATTDYTAADTGGTPDTTAAPTPAAAEPAGAPDTGADAGADSNAGADPGAGGEGEGMEGEGAPTDYTAGGGDEGAEGAEGGDPNAGGGEGMEGGEGTEGGGDMGGGAEGGGDEGGYDDYGSDDSSGGDGSGYDQQIQDLEKDIYADLNEPQMDIRNRELKQNFVNLYNMIGDISERINDISKDTASIKPLEFVASKLNKLSDTVSDYLTTTFSTKSYMENEINYNLFLKTIEDINAILASIGPKS